MLLNYLSVLFAIPLYFFARALTSSGSVVGAIVLFVFVFVFGGPAFIVFIVFVNFPLTEFITGSVNCSAVDGCTPFFLFIPPFLLTLFAVIVGAVVGADQSQERNQD